MEIFRSSDRFFMKGKRTMKELENKIINEGTVLPGHILKVGNFLNQQIDVVFMKKMAEEVANLFAGEQITKVLTIEASGIAFAFAVAAQLNVPMAFAKKHASANIGNDTYKTVVHSYTHGKDYTIVISKEYLNDCATDAEYAAKIGTEIAFMGKTLTVSGILYSLDAKTYDADRSDSFLTNYRSDPYYNGNYGKHIYMDYDLLAEIGTLQESEENNRVIGYYPGLYDDRDAWNAFKDAIRGQERVTGINALDRMGRNMQEYFSTMSFFLLGIFAIFFVKSLNIFNSLLISINSN